jgi:hypothetical protein
MLTPADAVVTRGAAGRMASQFSNLLFLDHVLHFTDVMIIHHTGNHYSHCYECLINEIYRLLSAALYQRRRLSSADRACP